MVTPEPHPPAESAPFLRVFAVASGGAPVDFARFMELALYHPEAGYYRRHRPRVGLEPGTDFHTATSLGPVFGELVVAAALRLLGPEDPQGLTFVELGAEPGGSVLAGVAHPFGAVRTLRLGDDLQATGRCIVFSNELFDAQPFHRLRRSGGRWRETGVVATGATLAEVDLPDFSPAVQAFAGRLPDAAPEGYRLDLPLAAAALCAQLAAGTWTGLFLAFDYGKSWAEMAGELPAGTARAYRQHRQVADLLAHPGEQDLTCHLCWDWLADALATAGFETPVLESQEAFFLHHAATTAERIATAAPRGPDPRRSRLQHLLHPALLGQRFQVLWARRQG